MIKYRKATNEDFDLAFQIKKRSIKIYIEKIWGWDDQVQLNFHIGDFTPEYIQIISDINNRVLGFINISENDAHIYIKSILIDSPFQGQGVGSKIITDIIHLAQAKNKTVELQVYKINERAKKLYEKLGFKITGQTELHYQMRCI